MEISIIKPYSKNAKKHPKKQIEQIANSIKEFGFNQPIVVDKENVIIVGHGRLEAAKLLGLKDVPVITVDLTPEQANSYRLADNKLNESEWDMKLVIEELKGLSDPLIELSGFDKDLIIEPDENDDVIPETPEEPKSKLGDLYILGNHRVLCGDSTKIEDVERLMDGKKADIVVTDPPYNTGIVGKKGEPEINNRFGLDYQDIWRLQREMGRNKDHATAKPIELCEKPIKHASKQDDIVFDLFLGSGSTLIASEKLQRYCYGMELDPKYIDVIVQRYVDYTGNESIIKNGETIIWPKTKTI